MFVFMPKIARSVVDKRKELIEAAALRVFGQHGFRASTIREIARTAGLSTGNIYNYYPSKEALYVSLVKRYKAEITQFQRDQVASLKDPFSPTELKKLAAAIGKLVDENLDYWRLMYVDVIEFQNRHFAETLHDMRARFKRLLGPVLRRVAQNPRWNGMDPALAFAVVYLHYFYYFLVERLYRPRRHLGISDEEAINELTKLFTEGLWRREPRGRVSSVASRAKAE